MVGLSGTLDHLTSLMFFKEFWEQSRLLENEDLGNWFAHAMAWAASGERFSVW